MSCGCARALKGLVPKTTSSSPSRRPSSPRGSGRRCAGTEPDPFVLGGLAIDFDRRRVAVVDRLVELTATEFELLRVLSLNGDRVTTYDAIRRQVWRERNHANPKLVRAFVKKLRHKLCDDPNLPACIVTERGTDYRMAQPEEQWQPSRTSAGPSDPGGVLPAVRAAGRGWVRHKNYRPCDFERGDKDPARSQQVTRGTPARAARPIPRWSRPTAA